MPEGNELAQRPGVGNETVECFSLRKLQYVRRRSCVRSANALVLERLCRPPQARRIVRWNFCRHPEVRYRLVSRRITRLEFSGISQRRKSVQYFSVTPSAEEQAAPPGKE